jgi:flavin prenyltransferase
VSQLPIVMAISGASGAPYAVRLLQVLATERVPVWLIVTSHGQRLLSAECGIATLEELRDATGGDWTSVTVFPDTDRGAKPASGSAKWAGMVICPCSMGTLASIAAGTSRSLVERAADVALKERRPLLMVTRETPLSLIHLENMRTVTLAGATVMPAAPGFYHRPQRIDQLVDFIVARALDHLGVPNSLAPRWGEPEA